MSMKTLFSKLPIYIPKVQDSTISEIPDLHLPAVLIDSPHIAWRPKSAKDVKKVSDLLIVDPVTHCILYKDASEGKNFQKLPYPQKVEPETLYSDAAFRNEKIVAPCIEDQINKGADLIISPYFFAEDTDDTKFGTNITMISESIKYLTDLSISKPLFAMIAIGSTALDRPIVTGYIADRYSVDLNDHLAGYFIVVNDLDCKQQDGSKLFGLAKLVFQLSKEKYVFVKRIGAFGEVLSAIGGSGFISGLEIGETFSVKVLEKKPDKFGQKTNRIYIPELFDYVNDVEAQKIGYKCNCIACKGSLASDRQTKKLHYLYTRLDTMEKLQNLDRDGKVNLLISRLDTAFRMASTYNSKYGLSLKTAHLVNWKSILEASKTWNSEEEEDNLEAFLNDLKSS